MKRFVLILFVVSFVNCVTHMFEVFNQITGRCNSDSSAVNDLKKIPDDNYVISQEAKCLLACFHTLYKCLDADGKVNPPDVALASINGLEAFNTEIYKKMKALVVKCSEETQTLAERCETSYHYGKCCMKVAQEVNLSPEEFLVANIEDV